MAIREIGYRHWEGTYTSHAFRWWTVTRAALRSTVYSKGRLVLLLILVAIAWAMPFFQGLFWFFLPPEAVTAIYGEGGGGLDRPLRQNLDQLVKEWQWMWGVLFSAVVGSRLVSNDLRSEALYIYLAKPLRRIDYIIGKMLACVIWLIPITIAPALWVYAAVNGASNKQIFVHERGEIFLELLWVELTFMFLCSVAAVTISSLTKRWVLALVGWVGAMFISVPIAVIAREASRNAEWLYLSPVTSLWTFSDHVFEQNDAPNFFPDWAGAAWVLHGLIVFGIAVFITRVLRIEVSE